MNLHICEVTSNNWREVANLSLNKDQQKFIESTAFCLAESRFEENSTSVSLYDGKQLIGYAMYGWYCDEDQSIWLDRFMIDASFQGKGYAKPLLRLLIEYLHQKFHCKTIYLSIHPDNKFALRLYESIGFRLNGEIDEEWQFGFGLEMEFSIN
ncbi:GNAT family N-acetyltransferase [Bacillus wiedmannii]|uniref:GNAT family N-acetyltransferase n=1 Tax=Bacillus wiedmannii TaxID=1890302 RepID=A0A4U3AS20_9BACI|nr:GNAT family N-acetyltransferase [Bacillus wiedmannii]MCU4774985.1 GNAT family N-acetyltransferase [Bacillus cereus]TKH17162.1 GNAT family N-acetyltransferase [Bacillus wiedmannii]TKI91277.1 GNAT family N-acetyltransferase [Bacillus wiedmannii]